MPRPLVPQPQRLDSASTLSHRLQSLCNRIALPKVSFGHNTVTATALLAAAVTAVAAPCAMAQNRSAVVPPVYQETVTSPAKGAAGAPYRLMCEGKTDLLGIALTAPRLGWWLDDNGKNIRQSAYQIVVARSLQELERGSYVWDSGKVASAQSANVLYAGSPLQAQQRYFWKVRVWEGGGNPSAWSQPSFWETGLDEKTGWRAKWIAGHERDTAKSAPAIYFRTAFTVPAAQGKTIESARLYATARGIFEAWINGKRVGEDYFAPGWTDYNIRNQYLTYDVTAELKRGENVLGFILGDGWHNGYLMWGRHHKKNWYGEDTSLLAQLVIRYSDGSEQVIGSDESWRNRTGAIIASDFYDGETYDARRALGAWSSPAYNASSWWPSTVVKAKPVLIDPKVVEPVRKQMVLKPVSVTKSVNGEWVYDFGQNLVGWVRVKTRGEEGNSMILRFAEMLDPKDGTLFTDNLRKARVTDTYHFANTEPVEWEPSFTFHGFRYAGVRADKQPESVEAIVVHTQMPLAGTFETSNELVNRLQQNINWSLRGNFLEVPTDCPQRDERLGWTGDAQAFIRTAIYNRDVLPFFEKWMTDMRDAQSKDGQFPDVVPKLSRRGSAAGWGDAGVICPWALYEFYGDKSILEQNYAAMKAWVDFQERTSAELIRPESGYGDWLALDKETPTGPGDTNTPRALVGTAYFAHGAWIVSEAAKALGNEMDAKHYAELNNRVRKAFADKFIDASGRVSGQTQTAYLLALGFDLVPTKLRSAAEGFLIDDIRNRGWHLSTGFIGTSLLMPVLDKLGRNDVAYRLLMQETFPSWLYSVLQGSTTMWERWNSYSIENGFGPGGMNSFNHYAYGAVGQWLYAVVGGIAPLEPGFKKIQIRPVPGGGLTWAKTHYDCPYGRIATEWKIEGNTFHLKATVPPNTEAVVILPDGKRETVGSGSYAFSCQLPPAVQR